MSKPPKKILKLLMIIGILALVAIVVFSIMMLFGTPGFTNGCLMRYTPNSSGPNSSYTTESSITLNGNGSYDSTVDSNTGAITGGTTFGQWKNTNFSVTQDQATVNLNIKGRLSLCKAYLPQYNLESQTNQFCSGGVCKKIPIPRVEDAGDPLEIKFDASVAPSEWRNITKLADGDYVVVKIKPNAKPTDSNLTNKYFTSHITGKTEGPYDCSGNQDQSYPVCGRYGLSVLLYYINECFSHSYGCGFLDFKTCYSYYGTTSSQYIIAPYSDEGKANFLIFNNIEKSQKQVSMPEGTPNIFTSAPTNVNSLCQNNLLRYVDQYGGQIVSGSSNDGFLGWGASSSSAYEYPPQPVPNLLSWYVADPNFSLGLIQRMDVPTSNEEPNASQTRGSQYGGSPQSLSPNSGSSNGDSSSGAEGSYNGDEVPVDQFTIVNFIPGMDYVILQDQYSGNTQYLQYSFIANPPPVPVQPPPPPTPTPSEQGAIQLANDLQTFMQQLQNFISAQGTTTTEKSLLQALKEFFMQSQTLFSKQELDSGGSQTTLAQALQTFLNSLSTNVLKSPNASTQAFLNDLQIFLSKLSIIIGDTQGTDTKTFLSDLQTFAQYLQPLLGKSEGTSGTFSSNLQTFLGQVQIQLAQKAQQNIPAPPPQPTSEIGAQPATGGYIFQIKQTACQRFNGQPNTVDKTDPYPNRGAIKYMVLPLGVDPNTDSTGLTSTTLENVADDGSISISDISIQNPNGTSPAPTTGVIWMLIDNDPSDYPDSIGQYTVSYVNTSPIDSFGAMTGEIFSTLQSIIGSAKQMFAKMTCDPSSGLDVSSCSHFFNYIRAMLTLYIVLFGLMFLLGMVEITVEDLVIRVVKISIVAGLMDGSTFIFFQNYVFDFVLGMSDELIADITGVKNFSPSTGMYNPFMFMDEVMSRIFFSPLFVAQLLATFSMGIYGVFYFIIIVIGIVIFVIAALRSLAIYVMAFTAIALLIGIGPLFLTFMLFNRTYYLFENWSRMLIRYSLEPAILIIGLSVLSQLFTIYLDYVLNYSVCWKCALTFEIPFALPVLPNPFQKIPLFCLNWFGAWGLDNSVDLMGMSMQNIVALVMIAYCLNGYVDLVGNIVGRLTNTPGAPSATSMGMALSGAIGQKALGTVGLDKRNRDRKLNSVKEAMNQRSKEVDKALAQRAKAGGGKNGLRGGGRKSLNRESGGRIGQSMQSSRSGQTFQDTQHSHPGAQSGQAGSTPRADQYSQSSSPGVQSGQGAASSISDNQKWTDEGKTRNSMDAFLQERGLTLPEDKKVELAKYATLRRDNPIIQAKLDEVYNKGLNDVVDKSDWSASDKKAFVELARTSGKKDSVDISKLQGSSVSKTAKPTESKPKPPESSGAEDID